jgi:alanine transaminase
MSSALKGMEYAVRGKVVIAADKINDELNNNKNNDNKRTATTATKQYPFDHIVYTNIGNPHSVGLHPLTWPRQVLALVDLPNEVGVDNPSATQLFPPDAIRRARLIKQGLGGGGTGAYSHSKGVKMLREDVAHFIQQRDGGVAPVNPDNIFLTNGASDAINSILTTLIANPSW